LEERGRERLKERGREREERGREEREREENKKETYECGILLDIAIKGKFYLSK
jgi:hypothetical protein